MRKKLSHVIFFHHTRLVFYVRLRLSNLKMFLEKNKKGSGMSVGREAQSDQTVKEIQSEQNLPPLPPSPEMGSLTPREMRPAPPEMSPLQLHSAPITPPAQRPAPPPVSPRMMQTDDEILNDIDDDFEIVTFDELVQPDPAQPAADVKPPRLNLAQRFAGSTVSFMETTAALVWGTGLVVEKEVPLIGVPGDYAVTSLAAIGAKEALESLRILSRREHPFDYLFFEGGGNFAKGLGMELGKKIAAAIPAVLLMLAASYGRDKLFNMAMADPENNQILLPLLFLFDTPILRSILIGVPSLLLYFAGQKAIERFVPGFRPPEIPPIDNEDTHWYQKLLDDGLLTINSLTMAGLGRELFNTLGPAIFLHSPYSLLMAPIAALFILPLLHYAGEELHPFQSLQDFYYGLDPKPVPATVLDDANHPEPEKEEGPTKARIAANIATKLGIALGVFALAALVNRYASAAVSNVVSTIQDGMNDPAAWKPEVRIGYEAALVAGMIFAQRMFEHLPAAIEAVKKYGPDVVNNIKKGVPMVASNIGNGVTSAASVAAQSVKLAAQNVVYMLRPSMQGMFAEKKSARPLDGKKIQVLQDGGNPPPIINLDEFDFDFPIDENVTDGLTI